MKGYVYLGKELIEKIENITDVDCESKGDLVKPEYLTEIIEDLIKAYEDMKYEKEEEIDNLQDQLEYERKGC